MNYMEISFFEDKGDDKTLDKLSLLNFRTKLYLVVPSYNNFNKDSKKFKNKFIKNILYWPTLKIKGCYWISPFSNKSKLIKVFEQNLNSSLLDKVELNKAKLIYLKNMYEMFKSKRKFKEFVDDNKNYIIGRHAEGAIKNDLLDFFGLNFNPLRYNDIIINSLANSLNKKQSFIKREVQFLSKWHKDKYLLYINGIKNLDKDLKVAKKLKAEEVIIYKFGLLKKEHLRILKKYLS